MGNVRDDLSLSGLELVVLARLSVRPHTKPPGVPELGKAVRELALPSESPARAKEVALETLAALRARGLVSQSSSARKGQLGERSLTDDGGRALRAALGLARTPSWSEVRGAHLPALALGLQPGSDPAVRVLRDGDALAAAVLREHLEARDGATLAAVCDALIVEALALPPGPLTLDRIRAHVLARRARVEVKGTALEIAKRVAASVVRARNANKESLVPALGRRWVQQAADAPGARGPSPQATSPPPPSRPSSQPPAAAAGAVASEALLELVRDALPRVGPDGRFGDEKVFVSAVWHRLAQDHRLAELSIDRFKRWLLTANRDGALVLVRADLVGAMDERLVADSEIRDQGATFHFVLDPRAQAAATGRGTHVR